MPKTQRRRATTRCDYCCKSKLGCDKASPCGTCSARESECLYTISQQSHDTRPASVARTPYKRPLPGGDHVPAPSDTPLARGVSEMNAPLVESGTTFNSAGVDPAGWRAGSVLIPTHPSTYILSTGGKHLSTGPEALSSLSSPLSGARDRSQGSPGVSGRELQQPTTVNEITSDGEFPATENAPVMLEEDKKIVLNVIQLRKIRDGIQAKEEELATLSYEPGEITVIKERVDESHAKEMELKRLLEETQQEIAVEEEGLRAAEKRAADNARCRESLAELREERQVLLREFEEFVKLPNGDGPGHAL